MKKAIVSILSITLLVGGISSCGKSTRGKMSNEWKVDSYETKTTEAESNGDKTTTTTTMSGSTVSVTTEDSPSGGATTTTTSSGSLAQSDFTIKKDGTWEMAREYSFTSTPATGITIVDKYVETERGTWSFVGKSKEEDFKKNERVLFNTLASLTTETTTTTVGANPSTSTSSTSNDTYETGENTMIFTVTESKGKKLELTSDANHISTSGNDMTTSTTTTKISLTEK